MLAILKNKGLSEYGGVLLQILSLLQYIKPDATDLHALVGLDSCI